MIYGGVLQKYTRPQDTSEDTRERRYDEDTTKIQLVSYFSPQPYLTTVILDPPRAGAAGVMPWIINSGAKQIVYVSCHPSTLLRDAEILSKRGFELDALGAMDMFPQTAHVEAMALFERVGVK